MKVKEIKQRVKGLYVAVITLVTTENGNDTVKHQEVKDNAGLFWLQVTVDGVASKVKIYGADIEQSINYIAKCIYKLNKGVTKESLQDKDGDYDTVLFDGYKLPVMYELQANKLVDAKAKKYKKINLRHFRLLSDNEMINYLESVAGIKEARGYWNQ